MAQTSYHGSLDPELARIVRLCDPRFDGTRQLTFAAAGGKKNLAGWMAWGRDCFTPVLLPAISASLAHARCGEAREIQVWDGRLDTDLLPGARERSSSAGRELLRNFTGARAAGFIVRMQSLALKEETPAHFPIVHAMQCALFHVPRLPCLLSYLYYEWRAGGLTSSSLTFAEMIESFRPALAESAGLSSDDFSGQAAA